MINGLSHFFLDSGRVAAADRVCADPAADGADAHLGGQAQDAAAREDRGRPRRPRVPRLAGETVTLTLLGHDESANVSLWPYTILCHCIQTYFTMYIEERSLGIATKMNFNISLIC